MDGFKQTTIRFSIWAVNGSQNEVLVVTKINVNHQGFVVGYDIEIYVAVFLIDNLFISYLTWYNHAEWNLHFRKVLVLSYVKEIQADDKHLKQPPSS